MSSVVGQGSGELRQPVLCVDYVGPAYPLLSRLETSTACPRFLQRILRRLFYDSNYRRNPRPDDYMRRLVAERFGEDVARSIRKVTKPEDIDPAAVQAAGHVLLLWRDGNGSGSGPVERRLLALIKGDTPVTVVNGRRRVFPLTNDNRSAFRTRRVLEKMFLLETVGFVLFWIVTPVMALYDLLRGETADVH